MIHSRSIIRRRAFTLIELLVVIAIIGLLAALLFPAFKRAQENGYQASCASNLQQIYTAVQLYRQDEKSYPGSLAFLLPNDFNLGAGTANNPDGTGHFRGGRDGLVCSDDDATSTEARSSYGDISGAVAPTDPTDMGAYVWNYWGYLPTEAAGACTSGTVGGCAGTAYQTSVEAGTSAAALRFDPLLPYDARTNPLKYSLSNRFAPTSTIITHCVYHRLPTASGKLAGPYEITIADGSGNLARDIVLRLDGSAKTMDVSKFHTNSNWATHTFK